MTCHQFSTPLRVHYNTDTNGFVKRLFVINIR